MADETPTKREHHRASFTATHVPFLAQFDAAARDWGIFSFNKSDYFGLQIEPHPERGVWLTVTDTRSLVQVWDETGFASAPFVLSMPRAFVDACRTPTMRTLVDANGMECTPKPPDWLVPKTVTVLADWKRAEAVEPPDRERAHSTLVIVSPVAQHPEVEEGDDGYSLYVSIADTAGSWHRPVARHRPLVPWHDRLDPPADAQPLTALYVNPDSLGRFAMLGRPIEIRASGDPKGPMFVRVYGPEIIRAAVMPTKSFAEIAEDERRDAEREAEDDADA